MNRSAIYAKLDVYRQDDFALALLAMRYQPKTISLREDVIKKGMERAKLFRLKFSAYISYLIEKDYESATRKIVIVAEPDKHET